MIDPSIPEEDLSLLDIYKAGKAAQEGCFAASAGAKKGKKLALLDLKVDVGEGPLGPVILDPDVDELDHG